MLTAVSSKHWEEADVAFLGSYANPYMDLILIACKDNKAAGAIIRPWMVQPYRMLTSRSIIQTLGRGRSRFLELVLNCVQESGPDGRQTQQSRSCNPPSMDGGAVPVVDLTQCHTNTGEGRSCFLGQVIKSVQGCDLDSSQRKQSRRSGCNHPSMDGAAVPVADLMQCHPNTEKRPKLPLELGVHILPWMRS